MNELAVIEAIKSLNDYSFSLRNCYISEKRGVACYEFIDLQYKKIVTILFKKTSGLYYGVIQDVNSKINKPPMLRFNEDCIGYSDMNKLLYVLI